jgi:DNA-binding LacI/PurR family transcriptional regulator
MTNTRSELDDFLAQLARDAQPGDRLPTIRDLMRRFGVSQAIVQRAFDGLKSQGLIASEVGRGTYFRGAGTGVGAAPAAAPVRAAAGPRSVLLLRRSVSVHRGRVLIELLQRRFAADGHKVLEVSYTDPDHARTVLRGLPRFDACVIQSSFRTIPIDLLAAVREKSEVLAVDGAALVGTDVEAVGMEWGEPLGRAVALLRARGHAAIAYATTSQPFFAVEMGRRRFASLRAELGDDVALQEIALPQLPDSGYAEALVEALREQVQAAGRLPFTALVAWGIENGAALREALAQLGCKVPTDLSVVLLGRTDLPNEHADFFDTVGCSVADQAEALYQAVAQRWADPAAPFGVRLIPVTQREGASVAAAGRAARGKGRLTAAA